MWSGVVRDIYGDASQSTEIDDDVTWRPPLQNWLATDMRHNKVTDLPPIATPAVPYPPALIEGDKRLFLQKTTILVTQTTDQQGYSRKRMERLRSLANIRRVLRDRQRYGFRLDGAVENLGLIREAVGEKSGSATVDSPEEKQLERNHQRVISRKIDIAFEGVFEGLKARLGYPLVKGRGQCGHCRSLDKRTAKGAKVLPHHPQLFISLHLPLPAVTLELICILCPPLTVNT